MLDRAQKAIWPKSVNRSNSETTIVSTFKRSGVRIVDGSSLGISSRRSEMIPPGLTTDASSHHSVELPVCSSRDAGVGGARPGMMAPLPETPKLGPDVS
ncbi:hypothetical protein ACLB2K_046392 [Fragaria x ananassa]